MAALKFWIVDVFAEAKFAGNPLAVVLNAGALSRLEMQQIAREINFSETSFVRSDDPVPAAPGAPPSYDVRIFTPVEELPFAGHPSLGTAYVIQQALVQQPIGQLILTLPIGPVPITLTYTPAADSTAESTVDVIWMQQPAPEFGAVLTVDQLAPVLKLNPTDFDTRWPIQEVSTGLPFILVPLPTRAALDRIAIDRDAYYALIAQTQAQAIFTFCPEAKDPSHAFSARMFGDALGIPEDPATGSANGCLAGYLIEHRYLDSDAIAVAVEQGDAIGRPALLRLQASRQGEAITIAVGGRVVPIAQGNFI
jgi:trans-2,3-dihydro-3-hydroxyanthranilate isomerase